MAELIVISGRSEAASLLGRTKPGREAEAGGEVGRVFFAGPSCAAGYPDQMDDRSQLLCRSMEQPGLS